ncbi:MAG: GBS Bsp-like repeat-containing protein [Eubacterium sp.]|nr:GBS Bsp-like repeat-containing protein [Eubacterium sp.]
MRKTAGIKKTAALILAAVLALPAGTFAVSADEDTQTENEASFKTAAPSVFAEDVSGDESAFRLKLDNYGADNAGSLRAGVWSDENGQDDLVWYGMSEAEGSYTCMIEISNHSSAGRYSADIWDFSGSPSYVAGTSFTVTSIPRPSYALEDENAAAGTFRITVSGLNTRAVSQVRIPTWCASDQSDIVWYTAQQSGGTYYVDADIASHANHRGRYTSHIYVFYNNGQTEVLGGLYADMSEPENKPEFSSEGVTAEADPVSGEFTLTVAAPSATYGIGRLRIAVWTAADGQDDLIWYTAEKSADGSYVVKSSISAHNDEEGKYNCHAYITDTKGNTGFCGAAEMTVTLEEEQESSEKGFRLEDENAAAGTFRITVSGLNTRTVSQVRIPTWCASDQSDIVWYTAQQSGGTYYVDVDIASHANHRGRYTSHIYVYYNNGKTEVLGGLYADMTEPDNRPEFSSEGVTAEADPVSGEFILTVAAPSASFGIERLRIAVWTAADGQDDLIWYTAEETEDGSYVVNSSISAHNGEEGKYNCHAYITDKKGNAGFCGAAEMNIVLEENPDEVFLLEDVTEGGLSQIDYRIVVPAKNSFRQLHDFRAAVWSVENGQDDLVWYPLAKQGNAGYIGTFSTADHKSAGRYCADVYALNSTGSHVFIHSFSFEVDGISPSVLAAECDENGNISVAVTGLDCPSGITLVRAAVWSSANGQDDIEWLKLELDEEGAYAGQTSVTKHRYNTGNYLIHVYADNGAGIRGFTCGSELEAFFTFDSDSLAMQEAAMKLDEIGWDLRSAYNWAVGIIYTSNPGLPEAIPEGRSHLETYATYGFEHGDGICYVYGAVMTCMARALGYDAYFVEGQVRYRDGSFGPHGWCEIDIDGTTYVYDAEFQHSYPDRNGFGFTYGTSGTWKYANWHRVE